MPDENRGDDPSGDPQTQPSPQPPVAAAPSTPPEHKIPHDADHGSDNQQSTAKELAREFRWVEFAQLIINGALAVIGIVALCIYSGQLNVMRGQLGEIIKQYPEIKKSADAAKSAAETANTTLKSNQDQFRIEERPIIWATNNLGSPVFVRSGQVVWTWTITNYGKTPAHEIRIFSFMKIGNRPWEPQFTLKDSDKPEIGAPIPPGKEDFGTVVSGPGVTEEEFKRIQTIDHYVSIRVRIEYQDSFGGHYETSLCFRTLVSGAINYCRGDAYIK
jgi:hypothetical protein